MYLARNIHCWISPTRASWVLTSPSLSMPRLVLACIVFDRKQRQPEIMTQPTRHHRSYKCSEASRCSSSWGNLQTQYAESDWEVLHVKAVQIWWLFWLCSNLHWDFVGGCDGWVRQPEGGSENALWNRWCRKACQELKNRVWCWQRFDCDCPEGRLWLY